MPASSLRSRLFLASTLAATIGIMVIVASSRPSRSHQQPAPLNVPGVHADSVAPLPPSPLAETATPGAGTEEDVAPRLADVPVVADSEPVEAVPAARPPQLPIGAAQGDDKSVSVLEVATEPATTVASEPAQRSGDATPGKKESGGDERQEAQVEEDKRPVVDPREALSREFARRKAVSHGAQQDAGKEIKPAVPEVYTPTVAMSQEHRQSCLVSVGDQFPDGSLPDVEGTVHSLGQSLGNKLTVVVLWTASNPYALDQFEELRRDVAPFQPQGVQAIAVHVGPTPENYAQLCQEHGQDVLCLTDADRAYFAQVARQKLPRTYLVNADGKILWLDLEYSRTTRFELANALRYFLQESN